MPLALAGGGGGGAEEAVKGPLVRTAKRRTALLPRPPVRYRLCFHPRLRRTDVVPGRQHVSPALNSMLKLIGSKGRKGSCTYPLDRGLPQFTSHQRAP